jgi:hypothetical protein
MHNIVLVPQTPRKSPFGDLQPDRNSAPGCGAGLTPTTRVATFQLD